LSDVFNLSLIGGRKSCFGFTYFYRDDIVLRSTHAELGGEIISLAAWLKLDCLVLMNF